jgi:hypothetical protein
MAKQLFMLAGSMITGFKPAINDDSAPISSLNQAYTEIYNKGEEQKNSAVIMEPTRISSKDFSPIYYSINHSPFSQSYLESSHKKSQISLLEEMRRIIEDYSKAILTNKPDAQFLYDVIQNTIFSYYHSDPSLDYPKIYNAKQLPEEDTRFIHNQHGEFPYSSAFLRGCIKISRVVS